MEPKLMKFVVIDPYAEFVYEKIADDLSEVLSAAKLPLGELDYGNVFMENDRYGVEIVVYEFGLKRVNPRTKERIMPRPYFGLHGNLYAGRGVLFSFDISTGDTINFRPSVDAIAKEVIWLRNMEEAEKAIRANLIIRPCIAINGKILAAWPNL